MPRLYLHRGGLRNFRILSVFWVSDTQISATDLELKTVRPNTLFGVNPLKPQTLRCIGFNGLTAEQHVKRLLFSEQQPCQQ